VRPPIAGAHAESSSFTANRADSLESASFRPVYLLLLKRKPVKDLGLYWWPFWGQGFYPHVEGHINTEKEPIEATTVTQKDRTNCQLQ
jgi:hypothetical protein